LCIELLNNTTGYQTSKYKSCVGGNISTFIIVYNKMGCPPWKKKRVLRVRVRRYDVILMIYTNMGISNASVLTFCLLFSRTLSCSTIRYPSDWRLKDILLCWRPFYSRFLKTFI